jgi:hypothetical protein
MAQLKKPMLWSLADLMGPSPEQKLLAQYRELLKHHSPLYRCRCGWAGDDPLYIYISGCELSLSPLGMEGHIHKPGVELKLCPTCRSIVWPKEFRCR